MDIKLPSSDLKSALAHPMVAALLNRMNQGAVVVSANERKLLAMNRRARRLLGIGDGPIENWSCEELVDTLLCRSDCVSVDALRGDDVTARDIFSQELDEDRVVRARTSVMVVRGPDGRPLAGIEFFSDVSELRRLERSLGLLGSFQGIIGGSPAMQQLYALIEQVAPYDLPVLVTGESGVGKERIFVRLPALAGVGLGGESNHRELAAEAANRPKRTGRYGLQDVDW